MSEKKNFDWGMHYFRGFAICCIVLTHLLQQLGHRGFSEAFFQGGTIYFLFISGYLCQFLDIHRRDTPWAYYQKKIKNVISPYLVFSLVTIGVVCGFGIVRRGVIHSFTLTIFHLANVLVCGRAQGPYWYIPFVTLLFLISPILVRIKTERLLALTLILFVIAILFPIRPVYFFLHHPKFINLYTYFTWTYLAGFVYARFKTSMDPVLDRHKWALLSLGFVAGIWLYRPGFLGLESCHRDLMMSVQKICFIGFVLVGFNKLRSTRIWILDQFAKYSFTIFFLYEFFVSDCARLHCLFVDRFACTAVATWFLDIVLMAAFLVVMMFLSMGLKLCFGKFSRSVIGS